MALTPGSRLGVFELTELIGRGGMGEVYRATDTKLKRQVAIKVLPPSLVADRDRLARFQREAEVLASLNHPNIAAIYGLEESEGITALVMELVEGDDLSQRIARGAIPIDEALPIAKQIAEALEAAHEQGIIHRDLKPANIKVRSDGTVKVLDFGLAKAMEPAAGSSPSVSMSPTLTTPAMTEAGMILGTAAYMAPEQAKGRTVDRRADVWAFGCVLFEMLTGTRAFAGDDVSEVLASVLARDPDWTRLPPRLSPAVVTFLRRCLNKNPKQRIDSVQDVRLALEGAFETAGLQATNTSSASGGRLAWTVAAAAVLGMVALAVPTVRHLRETPPPAPHEVRAEIDTPITESPASFALSPDGRQLVFVASGDGASRLWLRSLATTTAQPLAGTEGASLPFWSPDSRSIGFFAVGQLKRLDLAGGAPQALAPVAAGAGGAWTVDGSIVFGSSPGGLRRVSAAGGVAETATTLGTGEVFHHSLFMLPDGRRFVYYVLGATDVTGIYLGALDGRAPTRLTPADTAAAAYVPLVPGSTEGSRGGGTRPAEASGEGGWLLWVRVGTNTLMAQRLDVEKAVLTGEPVTVADGVGVVTAAATGLVAYRMGAGSRRQLTWVDRSGTARGAVGDPDTTLNGPRVSSDGRRVVVSRTVQGNQDIWLLDSIRMGRLTFSESLERFPVWSPDGTHVAYESNRTGQADVYQKPVRGAGGEEPIFASDQIKATASWSPDGRFLLYRSIDPKTASDLWVLPMVGAHTPSVFLKTRFNELLGAFSPDGRWVAYESDETGRMEVYVRPFIPPSPQASADASAASRDAAAGSQWQISAAGGIAPAWRPDGKELYYLNPAGSMMAVPIAVSGAALAPGAPVVLFPTRIVGGGLNVSADRQYDVAPDGRFLINTELESAAAPITLLMNWQGGLSAREK